MSSILDNRYRLIKLIGKGGMADVYLAYDEVLKREVAIKVLRTELSNDQLSILRFKQEAMNSTKLIHPNIVEVYDVGEYNKHNYIVMEYIKGLTLKNLIKKRKCLSLDETIFIINQLLNAILHAHKSGIIHRDIKPQNIIVKADGTVKILDFGIAIANDSIKIGNSMSIIGSVQYLAPEITSGKNATMQSDIYAIGIVLYECLTGQVPFKSENSIDVVLQHLNNKFPSVRNFDHSIPQSIENIITKCVAKDPKKRYQNVLDIIAELKLALKKENIDCTKLILDKTVELEKGIDGILKNRKKQKKNKTRITGFLLFLSSLASIVIIILVVSMLYLSGMLGHHSKTVKVPDIKGLTLLEAQEVLARHSLQVDLSNIKRELTDDIKKGLIINYAPSKDSEVEKGSKIYIVVSEGRYETMKNYVGYNIDDAKKDIEQNYKYINVILNTDDQSSEKPGTVIKQEGLMANEKFNPNIINTVKLTYRPLISIVVPHTIFSKTIEEAKTFFEQQGIKVEVKVKDTSNLSKQEIENLDKNKVVDTFPKPGQLYTQQEGTSLWLFHY